MNLSLIYYPFDSAKTPPLGLVSVATYLKDKRGYDGTRIINMGLDNPMKTLKKHKPDVVGVSAMSIGYGRMIKLARQIKQVYDVPVIVGGVHISTLPSSLHPIFDVGVVGEGEQAMVDLLRLYECEGGFPKDRLSELSGLVYHDGGVRQTPRRKLITPLDDVPVLDMSFLDNRYFKKHMIFWGDDAYCVESDVMTSRGCPYKCTFCSSSHFWGKHRLFSVNHVFEDIRRQVDDYGVTHFNIGDDLFTCYEKRIRELQELLRKEGLLHDLVFNCTARVNHIDNKTCTALTGLNVRSLNFGFESGSNRILRLLRKDGVTVEGIKRVVELCDFYGFHVSAGMIMGSPSETLEEMRATIDLIKWMGDRVDIVWLYAMTPYPGTGVWEVAKQMGRVSDDMDWENMPDYYLAEPHNHLLLDENITHRQFLEKWGEAKQAIEGLAKPQQRRKRLLLRLKHEPLYALRWSLQNPTKMVNYVRGVS